MSLKLSDLLNPVDGDGRTEAVVRSSSPPQPVSSRIASSSQASHAQNPGSYHAGNVFHTSPPARHDAIFSNRIAALCSPVPANPHTFCSSSGALLPPVLPPISSFATTDACEPGHTMPRRMTARAPKVAFPHEPSATTWLEQYSHNGARARVVEEARRQSTTGSCGVEAVVKDSSAVASTTTSDTAPDPLLLAPLLHANGADHPSRLDAPHFTFIPPRHHHAHPHSHPNQHQHQYHLHESHRSSTFHNEINSIPFLGAGRPHVMDIPLTPTTIQQVVPQQIREPSAAAQDAENTPAAPEPATRDPLENNLSPPRVKVEEPIAETRSEQSPLERTPQENEDRRGSGQAANLDDDTLKAIESAKNDFGLRAGRQKMIPSIEEPSPVAESTTAMKRPAPKVKKGQATVKKPPRKKTKVEDPNSLLATRRSLTPSRAKKSGVVKKSNSNTPALGSSPAPGSVVSAASPEGYASNSSDGEEEDENAVFCICRKGDNHTWMIACDGGCEDWFHGKCVNIKEEDGDLIDKYICPNCEKKFNSSKVTTWLPGCRNSRCRKPARIRKGNMSKYCSDGCGREFMELQIKKSEEARRRASGKEEGQAKPKRRGITMAEINGEAKGHADADDEDLGPRGGALKPSELKALITKATDIDAFRSLGSGVLASPVSAPPTTADTNGHVKVEDDPESVPAPGLSQREQEVLASISAEKDSLRRRRALLKDREKFGQLVREKVTRYAEREGIKPKDVCGYDSRLAWGEEEFRIWHDSDEGQAALSSSSLDLETSTSAATKTNGVAPGNSDEMDIDVPAPSAESARTVMCTKKRCERHRAWQKQTLADVRFEESQLADRMRALDNEERETKEAALLRARMDVSGLGGRGEVEVVG